MDHEHVVLVVEDDRAVRELIAVALGEEPGLRVVVAADGAEALAWALETPPSVVVVDMRLPVLDGHELARRLRADPRTARARIVAVGATGDAERARAAGCDAFLPKPFDLDVLLHAVGKALTEAAAPADETPSDGAAARLDAVAAEETPG